MLVMRPAQAADLPQVQRLAADSPVGVTSLPDDAERLRDKILASEASFAAEVSYNGEESYFFVLEDSASGELVGCSAIVASAGFSEPFYSFRNETFVHASRSLSIHNKIHVLSLCHDLTGNSLLTSFYVQRDLVQSVYAELNSRGRLLFMASHPERFADAVVVEIVGYSDEQGESPFWNAVGRNFFDLNYIEAEKLSGLKSRTFLAELMPHYPIYVPLLPDAAQESMGQVRSPASADHLRHPDARRLRDRQLHRHLRWRPDPARAHLGDSLDRPEPGGSGEDRRGAEERASIPGHQRPVAGLPRGCAGPGLGARQAGGPEC